MLCYRADVQLQGSYQRSQTGGSGCRRYWRSSRPWGWISWQGPLTLSARWVVGAAVAAAEEAGLTVVAAEGLGVVGRGDRLVGSLVRRHLDSVPIV